MSPTAHVAMVVTTTYLLRPRKFAPNTAMPNKQFSRKYPSASAGRCKYSIPKGLIKSDNDAAIHRLGFHSVMSFLAGSMMFRTGADALARSPVWIEQSPQEATNGALNYTGKDRFSRQLRADPVICEIRSGRLSWRWK